MFSLDYSWRIETSSNPWNLRVGLRLENRTLKAISCRQRKSRIYYACSMLLLYCFRKPGVNMTRPRKTSYPTTVKVSWIRKCGTVTAVSLARRADGNACCWIDARPKTMGAYVVSLSLPAPLICKRRMFASEDGSDGFLVTESNNGRLVLKSSATELVSSWRSQNVLYLRYWCWYWCVIKHLTCQVIDKITLPPCEQS